MSQSGPKPPTAASVAEPCRLGDAARALLKDGQPPRAYFQALVGQGLYRDAVQFAAHWLPKPAAVWWGCLCVWASARPNPISAPPNPSDVLSVAAIRAGLATLVVSCRLENSTSPAVTFAHGGAICSRIAVIARISSTAPAPPSVCPK